MGLVAFLAGFLATAVALLVIAALTAAAIAFFLPKRVAYHARFFIMWASVLSGAGYVSLALTWNPQLRTYAPSVLGIATAISYAPLCVLLLLRAVEPQWRVLVAARSLGLSFRRSILALLSQARSGIQAAIGLGLVRLMADAGALLLVYRTGWGAVGAVVLIAMSMPLFSRYLSGLMAVTRAPIYPPLFVPLPENPPRLVSATPIPLYGRLLLRTSLTLMLTTVLLEVGGLGFLRGATTEPPSATATLASYRMAKALATAIRDLVPLLAGAALLTKMTLRHSLFTGHDRSLWLRLAAISPLLLAAPAVALLADGWFPWLPLALVGLAGYVLLQNAGAHAAHAQAAAQTLQIGRNSEAATVGALGLPVELPTSPTFFQSQALSAAAAWLGAAALLAAISATAGTINAAHALVWSIASGALHLASLWLRGVQYRPHRLADALRANMEGLSR